jgi:hypothetical protein
VNGSTPDDEADKASLMASLGFTEQEAATIVAQVNADSRTTVKLKVNRPRSWPRWETISAIVFGALAAACLGLAYYVGWGSS